MPLNITLRDLRIKPIFNTLISALWRLKKMEVKNGYKDILGRPKYLSIELLGLKTII